MAKGGIHSEGVVHGEGGMCGEGGLSEGGVCGRGHVWQWGRGGHAWQERRPLQRTVCILLECILVNSYLRNHEIIFLWFNNEYCCLAAHLRHEPCLSTSSMETKIMKCNEQAYRDFDAFFLTKEDVCR